MIGEKEKNFVSAVIYVRNNGQTLRAFLEYVDTCMEGLFENYEIICVDDASTDSSAEIIRQFAADAQHAVTLVSMGYFQGTEMSMSAGEDLAIGDFVYEFDTALRIWPEDMIEKLYQKMQEGYDIISACPNGKSRLSSRFFYHVFNRYSNLQTGIRTEAFRLISRRAINRVSSMHHVQMYKKAVNANSGLRQTYLEFAAESCRDTNRKNGKERRTLAMNSLILFTDIGYKIAFVMSLIMLVFAAVVGIYTVIVFATGHPVEGWTPIMIFLAIGFFVLFAILTFVIKYLSLILNLNFRRQRYVVQDVQKL